MKSKVIIMVILFIAQLAAVGQNNAVFRKIPLDSMGIATYEVFPTI